MKSAQPELDAVLAAEDAASAEICLFCGEPEVAELFEVWGPREFQLETCCQGMHEAVCDFLSNDPKGAARWLNGLGLAAMTRGGVRRVIDDGMGGLVLDFNLQMSSIPQKSAKEFVRTHHRHCPPPAGWKFGGAILNGSGLDEGSIIGVVMVGRPVAKAFDHTQVIEVNRLCIREDLPDGLQWNACSLAYGWAAREAKRRGFLKIITYTLESEPGTSLKAAGWTPEARVRGRSWNTPSRPREDRMELVDKIRWARTVAKKKDAAAPFLVG